MFTTPYPQSSPEPDRVPKFQVESLPPGDTLALARFLVDCIPCIKAQNNRQFSAATKDMLVNLGLASVHDDDAAKIQAPAVKEKLLILFDSISHETRTLVARTILTVVDQHGAAALQPLIEHSCRLVKLYENDGKVNSSQLDLAFRKLFLAFAQDKQLGLHTFQGDVNTSLQEREALIRLELATITFLTTRNVPEAQAALKHLKDVGRHNDVPYLDNSTFAEARNAAKREAQTAVKRAYRQAFNFHRVSAEARRPGKGHQCLIAQFGDSTFDDCRAVYGSTIDKPPGRGYYLSQPRPEALLFEGTGKERGQWYQRAFAQYGDAVTQFDDLTTVLLRSNIIVHNNAATYKLPVSRTREEPFCYVVENNHFTGCFELAGMFPVKIVQKLLMESLVDLRPSSDGPFPKDVTNPGFNIQTLIQKCHEAGLPPLLITNISTLFGGCIAAYPKNSEPYYHWEEAREKASSAWRDASGRVHHAWYARGVDGRREMEALFRPLGEGCTRVAAAIRGYQNLLDLFWHRYDAWKCDHTPGEAGVPRMLTETYRWFNQLTKSKAPESAFPILCRIHRYNWDIPPTPLIDTAKMTLNIGDGRLESLPLSSNGDGDREFVLWRRHVEPQLRAITQGGASENEWTLAFLLREYVF